MKMLCMIHIHVMTLMRLNDAGSSKKQETEGVEETELGSRESGAVSEWQEEKLGVDKRAEIDLQE